MSNTTVSSSSSSTWTATSTTAEKLAFCFLTKNGLRFPQLWTNYLKDASPDRVSIWIHSHHEDSEKPSVYSSRISRIGSHVLHYITRRNTRWGEFSLLRVQQALAEAACKDPSVSKVLFLADTAVPIQSFPSLYTTIIEQYPSKGFLDYKEPNNNQSNRSLRVQQRIPDAGGWPMGWNSFTWFTASQWCVLTRIHVSFLSQHWRFIETLFDGSTVPDEHVYPVMFHAWNMLETTFVKGNLTYIHWWDTPEEWEEHYSDREYGIDCPIAHNHQAPSYDDKMERIFEAKEYCQDSPRTYHSDELNREMLTELATLAAAGTTDEWKDYMFLRKVCCLPDELNDRTW